MQAESIKGIQIRFAMGIQLPKKERYKSFINLALLPSNSSIQMSLLFLWKEHVARYLSYLHTPHTRGVIKGRVNFSHFVEVTNIPNIQAMIVVNTGQPVVGGVV